MSLRFAVLGLAVLCACAVGVQRGPGLGDVTDLRHWSYDDYTRVVIELSDAVRIKSAAKLLPASGPLPERLFLDLEGIWVGRDYIEGVPIGDTLLRRVRVGQNTATDIRVVLDLQSHARHRVLTLAQPPRLVIDVFAEGRRSDDGAGPRLPYALRRLRKVVIDPGHGGKDPGAIGVGGLREKDVTLKLARALERRLEARQFDVVMTRDEDRTLSLEERTAIAEGAGGDIFVSVHANASRRSAVHGIETYYLDENHERHTLTVAARENGVQRSEVNALQRTLAKLRVSEVSPLSRRLAELIQGELVTGLPKRFRPVEDLGVKRGPFYVLFLSSMPAVLVETGFLTHRGEAKRLSDGAYLEAQAEAMAEALSQYREAGASRTARSPR